MIALAFWIAVWLVVIVVVGCIVLAMLGGLIKERPTYYRPLDHFDHAAHKRAGEAAREAAYQAKAAQVREQMRKWGHRS